MKRKEKIRTEIQEDKGKAEEKSQANEKHGKRGKATEKQGEGGQSREMQ